MLCAEAIWVCEDGGRVCEDERGNWNLLHVTGKKDDERKFFAFSEWGQ